MKKIIYFLKGIMLIGMISLMASCGDSSDFFDEAIVYKTRTRSYTDKRLERLEVIPGSHTFEPETLRPGITATFIFNWTGSPDEHLDADCEISIDSIEKYKIVHNYTSKKGIQDDKAIAHFYIEIHKKENDSIYINDFYTKEIKVKREWHEYY